LLKSLVDLVGIEPTTS